MTSYKKPFARLMCTALCIATTSPSFSKDQTTLSYPRISGNIITRLGFNGDYDSDAPLIEADDVFLQIIASPVFHLSDSFRFITETRVETVIPPSGDRYFEDQGYFARILLAEYSINDRLSIHAGKMTPSFALASFAIPGMYGNSYNREIELIDQVGFGGEYVFSGTDGSDHTFTFNTFFEDTTIFSESLGNNRGRTSIEDGGASNTEGFDSFAVSLEGSNILNWSDFSYKLGFLHRAKGTDGIADENGISASFVQTYEKPDGADWTVVGEIAALNNFEGTSDDIIYASAGLVYNSGPWTGVLSGTYRPRFIENSENFEDYTLQTSIEYDLGKGYSVAIAHEFNRDQNADNRRLGFRFSKILNLGN